MNCTKWARMVCAATLVLGCVATSVNAQVFAGLTVDFEDNTNQGFVRGAAGAQPTVESDGANLFLQSTSLGGDGANSAQLIQNQTTFVGDFIAAEILGISASVAVDPASDGPLFLRLAFTDSVAGGTGFSSLAPQIVPNDGQFVDVFFPINPTDLVLVPGTGSSSFVDVLSNVERFRILSAQSGPSYVVSPGEDRLASILRIDNIQAVGAVPEPGSVAVMLMASAALSLRRRRR